MSRNQPAGSSVYPCNIGRGLPFGQTLKACTLDGEDMHKDVAAILVRLNEAKAPPEVKTPHHAGSGLLKTLRFVLELTDG